MANAWRSVLQIHECAVAAYTPAGVALTSAEITAAGIVITQHADGSVSVTSNQDATLFYVRFTPNHGAGMGSAAARISIVSASDINSEAPRWDGSGTWASFNGPAELAEPETSDWHYIEVPVDPAGVVPPQITFVVEAYFADVATVGINCSCSGEDGLQYRTLAECRTDMLVMLGRGNQLANPGAGVALLIDTHLRNAQKLLFQRCSWLVTERYYSWPLLVGVRLYGFQNTAESCASKFNPTKVSWVGVVRDRIWMRLVGGIDPAMHSYDTISGIPQRYDIRQCIEVWPPPDITEGSLVIKGNFGLDPWTADDQRATIDDNLICQLAIATLKQHFRQPDADTYVSTAEVLLNNLIAGSHATNHYVPGRQTMDAAWIPPVAFPPLPPT